MDVVKTLAPKVLLISNKEDLSLDYVVAELTRQNVPFFRLNCEDLASYKCSYFVSKNQFTITTSLEEVRLGPSLQSVIYRRPGQPFSTSNEGQNSRALQKYVNDQWSAFILGLQSLSEVVWINPPEADSVCENKILQLAIARQLKFDVPETLIGTDSNQIHKFFKGQNSQCVIKALSSPLLEMEEGDYFVFSNIINSLADVSTKEFSSAPTIFQERIRDKTDVRVTVCGDKIFAVEILSDGHQDVPFDWRTCEKELNFVPIDLPADIQSKCFDLVKKFNLVFGAIDFVKIEDRFIFLEINPAGEWGWLQRRTNLNIAKAIVTAAIKASSEYELV